MNKLLILSMLIVSFFNLNGSSQENASSFENSDKAEQSYNFSTTDKIRKARIGFLKRWHVFGGDTKHFLLWDSEWEEEDLKIRFDQIMKERFSVYFTNPENFEKKGFFIKWKKAYEKPANWKSWYSRYPYPLALQYNLASPKYNASIITLRNLYFLAMEAPCEKNLNTFYQILSQYKVTDLIRLTPAHYIGREASFPYWESNLNIHSVNGTLVLEMDGLEINYFPTDCWKNHEGIEAEKLLALVKAVKYSTITDSKMIAVHCRAGIGRTGTFLVAYILLHDIDEQIANGIDIDNLKISIDKIIWELSLQRPFSVTHTPQYITLHQFVSCYINSLKSNRTFNPK